MRSILRRLSRSHGTAVAYLALFAALGGRHSHRHDPPADPHSHSSHSWFSLSVKGALRGSHAKTSGLDDEEYVHRRAIPPAPLLHPQKAAVSSLVLDSMAMRQPNITRATGDARNPIRVNAAPLDLAP